ncbi:MAG: glycyl-radical enzyme activating protein [Clostridia bacterium]|nr:glycyl-radical enzyme activating protein [Clostridia bacterium]
MEKKARILSFKRFEIHDGDGIRTTLFFKGCPLRCKWCHNPESLSHKMEKMYDARLCMDCMRCTKLCDANIIENSKHVFVRENCTLCGKCETVCPQKAFETAGIDLGPEEITEELFKDEIFMKNSGGGVTFSGGEPLIQAELCVEIAKRLKERDINIAIDTSAAVNRAAIDAVLPYVDTFLFDIKAMDEKVHIRCTGVSNKNILENILYVDSAGKPFEIRYPYVPTMNDGEWEAIATFVKQLKNMKILRILPYHNYADRKYNCLGLSYPMPDIPVPATEQVASVAEKMRTMGLPNVAVG